ncbi:hypothetical protein CR513_54521, partial [Mucuna pruriens]
MQKSPLYCFARFKDMGRANELGWICEPDFAKNIFQPVTFIAFHVGLKPPTYHEVSVSYLKKAVDIIQASLEKYKVEWEKWACTLMYDGWIDGKVIPDGPSPFVHGGCHGKRIPSSLHVIAKENLKSTGCVTPVSSRLRLCNPSKGKGRMCDGHRRSLVTLSGSSSTLSKSDSVRIRHLSLRPSRSRLHPRSALSEFTLFSLELVMLGMFPSQHSSHSFFVHEPLKSLGALPTSNTILLERKTHPNP